jgi:hypothetical protein
MLVPMFNAVKVESVPLNSNYFSGNRRAAATPRVINVGAQIDTMASVAKIVDKIGKRASEASPFSTSQLCRVRAQPREILPTSAPRDAALRER